MFSLSSPGYIHQKSTRYFFLNTYRYTALCGIHLTTRRVHLPPIQGNNEKHFLFGNRMVRPIFVVDYDGGGGGGEGMASLERPLFAYPHLLLISLEPTLHALRVSSRALCFGTRSREQVFRIFKSKKAHKKSRKLQKTLHFASRACHAFLPTCEGIKKRFRYTEVR